MRIVTWVMESGVEFLGTGLESRGKFALQTSDHVPFLTLGYS
jgi:hypothetical protein